MPPLRQTLERLVDLDALANPSIAPELLVTATDVEAGQIEYFYSGTRGLSITSLRAAACRLPSQ
jgi:hypothetical protein